MAMAQWQWHVTHTDPILISFLSQTDYSEFALVQRVIVVVVAAERIDASCIMHKRNLQN